MFVTKQKFSEAAARRVGKKIKKVDSSAEFVGPLSIRGNDITGWIERPDDGTNDHNHVRERNRQMAEIAQEVLANS